MIRFKKILVPTDFSELAKRAVDYAIELPRTDDSEILLVHAIEPTVYPIHQVIQRHDYLSLDQQVHRTCQQNLEDLKAEIGDRASVRPVLLDGHPATELVQLAETEGVDLIVVATHGHTGLKHLFLGSTTEAVLRRSPCPVLTVRTKLEE